jgi:hypothetical protein
VDGASQIFIWVNGQLSNTIQHKVHQRANLVYNGFIRA